MASTCRYGFAKDTPTLVEWVRNGTLENDNPTFVLKLKSYVGHSRSKGARQQGPATALLY